MTTKMLPRASNSPLTLFCSKDISSSERHSVNLIKIKKPYANGIAYTVASFDHINKNIYNFKNKEKAISKFVSEIIRLSLDISNIIEVNPL